MVQLGSKEETVMLALYDALFKDDGEGIINPSFYLIRESTDRVEDFTDDALAEVLRQLHEKGYVAASEAFRPRTHQDPTTTITPKGWAALDELGKDMPEEWLQAQEEILALLYDKEAQNWNDVGGSIYLMRRELERKTDIPGGIFDITLRYLVQNEWIASHEKGYCISELGARAHEEEKYTGDIRGYE